MTLFQWIALTFLVGMLLWEFIAFGRGRTTKGASLLRTLVWLAAAIAIAFPNLTQKVADVLGIYSGANVVLYLFVLAFLATSFYFYSRQVRLQRQITQLVRHIAIREAQFGSQPEEKESSKA